MISKASIEANPDGGWTIRAYLSGFEKRVPVVVEAAQFTTPNLADALDWVSIALKQTDEYISATRG